MKYFRWLSGLCLTVAAIALIGLPPAQAIAETLETAADLPVAASVAEAASSASEFSEVPISATEGLTDDNTTTVTNQITSEAQSGAATVANNQQAGSAISGDTSASSTVLTTVNTTTSLDDSDASLFSLQVSDTTGNIVLDDQLLGQPDQMQSSVVTIEDSTDIRITNNLTVVAASGDAVVANNVSAGNATSGNAQAAATVVTIANSVINAQHSFLGIITVNGNLIGDILLPARFGDNTFLSDDSPAATPGGTGGEAQIANNVVIAAQSGDSAVRDNQQAGSAATGKAATLVSTYNLVNVSLAATSMLWVFVNVLGEWDGTLLNEPPGSFSLFLGDGGVRTTGQNGDGSASNDVTIENNISVTAQSGNASVERNVSAGNATSGSSKALVSLLNISNSSVNATDWFGILFINVFGSWKGNLGLLPEPDPVVPPPEQTVPPPVVPGALIRPAQVLSATKTTQRPTVPAEGQQLAVDTQAPSVSALPSSPDNLIPTDEGAATNWLSLLVAVAAGLAVVSVLRRNTQNK